MPTNNSVPEAVIPVYPHSSASISFNVMPIDYSKAPNPTRTIKREFNPLSVFDTLKQYKDCSIQFPKKEEKGKKQLLPNEFSPEFMKSVCCPAESYITSDNAHRWLEFFKAYLEILAQEIATNNKAKNPLKDLMDKSIYVDAISFQNDTWYYPGYNAYSPYSTNHANPKKPVQAPTLIELIGTLWNCEQNKACAIVAALVGTDFKNLYNFTSDTHAADDNANNCYSFGFIPERIEDYALSD